MIIIYKMAIGGLRHIKNMEIEIQRNECFTANAVRIQIKKTV